MKEQMKYIETDKGKKFFIQPTLPDGTKANGCWCESLENCQKLQGAFQQIAEIYPELKRLAGQQKKRPLSQCFTELKEYALKKMPELDNEDLLFPLGAYWYVWILEDLKKEYGDKDYLCFNHDLVMAKLFNLKLQSFHKMPGISISMSYWAHALSWHALWTIRHNEIKGFWLENYERIDEYVAQWEREYGKPSRYLTVLSAQHFRECQEAMCKQLFEARPGTPWPTYSLSGGRGHIQLRPPQIDGGLFLPPEQEESLAKAMFKQIRELSDLDADSLDILTSTWITQARSVESRAIGDIDQFLAMRGLTPKHKGRGRAFKRKQRQEMLRSISRIQNLWFDMGEVEIYSPESKGRKKTKEAIQSRAFSITDTKGQRRLDGLVDVQKFIYVPGTAFAHWIFGPGRQVAQLSSMALKYDPYRQKPEKRLARLFTYHWRVEATTGRALKKYRVATLLDEIGEDEISQDKRKRYPNKVKERLEKALDQLDKDEVIAAWQYEESWNENIILEKRGWFDDYLLTNILVEAPARIQAQYQTIFDNSQKRLRKGKAALPGPTPAPAPPGGLGELLRKEIERRKFTQARLAEILEVTPAYVSQIVNSQTNPGAKVREKIRAWLEEKP